VKFLLLLVFFALTFTNIQAQRKSINGLVRDSITLFPLGGAIVTNGTTGKIAETDKRGFFHLDASVNDYIFALAENYNHDTLTFSYLFSDTISILLSPAGNILPNVIVKGNLNKYQLDSIDRKARFIQINGKPMSTLSDSHPSGFGLTFNLDKVFKKQYRERSESEKSLNRMEKRLYVDYRFSPHFVNYYTSLKGDQLREFMAKYTPTYEWLRRHATNEDVMYYINEKLKEYRTSNRR
jgi:hypothetical protein